MPRAGHSGGMNTLFGTGDECDNSNDCGFDECCRGFPGAGKICVPCDIPGETSGPEPQSQIKRRGGRARTTMGHGGGMRNGCAPGEYCHGGSHDRGMGNGYRRGGRPRRYNHGGSMHGSCPPGMHWMPPNRTTGRAGYCMHDSEMNGNYRRGGRPRRFEHGGPHMSMMSRKNRFEPIITPPGPGPMPPSDPGLMSSQTEWCQPWPSCQTYTDPARSSSVMRSRSGMMQSRSSYRRGGRSRRRR